MSGAGIKEIKIILLGNSGVGKTSIINRYINNKFEPQSDTTLGSSFCTKEIIKDGIIYKLNLWDTTGQEKYHSITNLFIKGSNIVILVYSIDSLSSFEGLNYWYKSLKDNLVDNQYVLSIVGSKSDLIKDEEEVVTEEEGRRYAKDLDAIFRLVSSKEDPEGIINLFDRLLEEIINRKYIAISDSYIIKNKKKNLQKDEKKKCC
jgi:small GTP-binding protein